MPLLTIEGTYEDGRIALAEQPQGLGRARVVVTFLPEVAEAAAPDDPQAADDEAKKRRREAGKRLVEMMERGINFGGEKFNREELYEERMDELDQRRGR